MKQVDFRCYTKIAHANVQLFVKGTIDQFDTWQTLHKMGTANLMINVKGFLERNIQ